MFLVETAAPTALQMAVATQRHGHSNRPSESAYTLAFNTSQTFQSAYEERAKLRRPWSAYLQYTGDMGDSVTELFSRLDWHSLRNACIVDVSLVAFHVLPVRLPSLRLTLRFHLRRQALTLREWLRLLQSSIQRFTSSFE